MGWDWKPVHRTGETIDYASSGCQININYCMEELIVLSLKGTTEGGEIRYHKRLHQRVISKQTANIIKSFMKDTVDYGTADNLTGTGISIAGKTGSAEASYRVVKCCSWMVYRLFRLITQNMSSLYL